MTVSNTDVIETINGQVQVSGGNASIGLLVERDGLFGGTLLSLTQAEQLANALLRRSLDRPTMPPRDEFNQQV